VTAESISLVHFTGALLSDVSERTAGAAAELAILIEMNANPQTAATDVYAIRHHISPSSCFALPIGAASVRIPSGFHPAFHSFLNFRETAHVI